MRSRFPLALTLLSALTGCAGFHQKYDPRTSAWAREEGKTTVVVVGSTVSRDGQKSVCNRRTSFALMMPDDRFYRDWIRVLSSDLHYKQSLPRQALDGLHYSPRLEDCVFTFPRISSGKWLVLFAASYHQDTDMYGGGPGVTFVSQSTAADLVYAPFEVTEQNQTLRLSVTRLARRAKPGGYFSTYKIITEGEVQRLPDPESVAAQRAHYTGQIFRSEGFRKSEK